MSPSALSPGGGELEENTFEAEFNGEAGDEESEDDGLDLTPPVENGVRPTDNFAVLNSSLPEQFSEQHHLASYMTAKRAEGSSAKERKPKTRWHFGIRSKSPPMEVMLEIYRTLKSMGMEWRAKRNLGGLGGIKPKSANGIQRAQQLDGSGRNAGHAVDLKAAASVYFIETRARVQDVVVRVSFDPLLLS